MRTQEPIHTDRVFVILNKKCPTSFTSRTMFLQSRVMHETIQKTWDMKTIKNNAKMHSVSLMRFWAIHYYVCIKVKAVCFILMWHNSEWNRIFNNTKCRAGFDFYASGTDWIPIFLRLDHVNWCYKKSNFIDRTNFQNLIEYYVDIHAMSCTACTYLWIMNNKTRNMH